MSESPVPNAASAAEESTGSSIEERLGVAAFDFDGTLVPGDSLHAFLVELLGRRRLMAVLARSALAMGVGYGVGGRDRAKAALLARAVHGLDAVSVKDTGLRFGHALAHRIRPDLRARLEWHRGQGHRLVLVSASLDIYLDPFGAVVGFDDVVATRLEVRPDGYLSGHLLGVNVRGPEKAIRLRSLLGKEPVELWAYGDSAGDREMLAMADHPTLVGGSLLRPTGSA